MEFTNLEETETIDNFTADNQTLDYQSGEDDGNHSKKNKTKPNIKKFISNVDALYKASFKIRSKREEDKNSSLLVQLPEKGECMIGAKEIEAIDRVVRKYLSDGIKDILIQKKGAKRGKGLNTPIYIGGTCLYDFIIKGNFGAQYIISKNGFQKTSDTLFSGMEMIQKGFVMKGTLKNLFALYKSLNKISEGQKLHFDDHMNECFNSSIPAIFIRDKKDEKVLMIKAVLNEGMGIKKPLNTVEAINYNYAPEKKFDPTCFIHFNFSSIECLNSLSKDLLATFYEDLDKYHNTTKFQEAYEFFKNMGAEELVKLQEEDDLVKSSKQYHNTVKMFGEQEFVFDE